jgi:hypothetical protein
MGVGGGDAAQVAESVDQVEAGPKHYVSRYPDMTKTMSGGGGGPT